MKKVFILSVSMVLMGGLVGAQPSAPLFPEDPHCLNSTDRPSPFNPRASATGSAVEEDEDLLPHMKGKYEAAARMSDGEAKGQAAAPKHHILTIGAGYKYSPEITYPKLVDTGLRTAIVKKQRVWSFWDWSFKEQDVVYTQKHLVKKKTTLPAGYYHELTGDYIPGGPTIVQGYMPAEDVDSAKEYYAFKAYDIKKFKRELWGWWRLMQGCGVASLISLAYTTFCTPAVDFRYPVPFSVVCGRSAVALFSIGAIGSWLSYLKLRGTEFMSQHDTTAVKEDFLSLKDNRASQMCSGDVRFALKRSYGVDRVSRRRKLTMQSCNDSGHGDIFAAYKITEEPRRLTDAELR